MQLPHTSSMRFLDKADRNIDAPIEWNKARIILPVNGLHNVNVYCQSLGTPGKKLSLSTRLIDGQSQVTADWPRADAGHYLLILQYNGQVLIEQEVTVQPKKISVDAYNYMLEDLDSRLPTSIALALQRVGALAGLKLLPPGLSTLAQEVIRLRHAIQGTAKRPGLIYVLKNLILAPYEIHKTFRTSEEWVPRARARRPHPSRLAQAMARPGNIDATKLPLRVLDTHVEHSFDTYENRLLKYYALQLTSHLHRLIDDLTKKPRKNETLKNVLTEANLLQKELALVLQGATFLLKVSQPAYLPTQTTMVLLKHPLYRIMLEGYLEFQQSPTVRLEEPALEAPLENLPKLYQVWGTLHVLAALLHVANELGYQIQKQQLARKDQQGLFIELLPNGKQIVELLHPTHHMTVRLIPERVYNPHGKDLHSITRMQRPDIAIEIEPLMGPTRIYIFDPKYKLESEKATGSEESSKPEKADIDKMHVYRDAIRDKAENHVVAYAAILYPGSTQQYHKSIEALQAYPDALLVEQLEKRISVVLYDALQ